MSGIFSRRPGLADPNSIANENQARKFRDHGGFRSGNSKHAAKRDNTNFGYMVCKSGTFSLR